MQQEQMKEDNTLPRDEIIQVIVSKNERLLIEDHAELDHRSLSQYCRLAILEKINKDLEE